MIAQRGFTLIELLLAVVLLTMVATAAVSWAVAQRRSGVVIEARYERLQQVLACRQAIQEDLILALATTAPLRPDETGRLTITTLRQLPGEAPGRRDVRWEFDGERRALVRVSRGAGGDQRRVAMAEVAAARFIRDDKRGLLLELSPLTGDAISLALRSDR